jgi:hypothetical protein
MIACEAVGRGDEIADPDGFRDKWTFGSAIRLEAGVREAVRKRPTLGL